MATKLPEKVSEQRRIIVERILADMEEKELSWTESWSRCASPHNPVTGTVYRGGNRFGLALVAMIRGYDDPRWVTWNNIKSKDGWKLRKGSKAAVVEKWKRVSFVEKDEDGEVVSSKSFMKCVGWWNVYNLSDVEGAPPYEAGLRDLSDGERNLVADRLIETSRCPVAERLSGEAFYSPMTDEISLPLRAQFEDGESFTRVLLHEMCHSTGHPSALDRNLLSRFGTPGYAAEELVAELGSVFASADLGLSLGTAEDSEHYRRHVSYLQSWMKSLRDDPDELFVAAAKAEEASRYIVDAYRAKEGEAAEAA